MASVPLLAQKTQNGRTRRSEETAFTVCSADQDVLFQLGVKAVVDRSRRLSWIGAINDGNRVLTLGSRLRPDILLLDARLDVGGNLIRAVTSSPAVETVIVLVSSAELTPERVGAFAEYGAVCLLDRAVGPVKLAERIVQYHLWGGSAEFLPGTPEPRIPRARRRNSDELTLRETQILGFISIGLTNAEIAEAQSVSAETVRSHVKNVYRKLGARNRAHAVALGHLENLIGPQAAQPAPAHSAAR
ncbi:response regulator transcription factor [Amycolatopsis sp. La24]|uniref:response regulator transcription factor n=1 Tax=Amycolatopsis sp. La24 TaxID=3028304 RepID=UPI0005659929|nr:response regulator transcription factor [Amycolatopsis sp. La24]